MNYFSRVLLLILTALSLSACLQETSPIGNGSSGGNGANSTTNIYFPMSAQRWWQYDDHGSYLDEKVFFGGQSVWPLKFDSGAIEYYSGSDAAVQLHGLYLPSLNISGVGSFDVELQFSTPIRFNPAIPASFTVSGSGWVDVQPSYGQHTTSYQSQVLVSTEEQVTVPQGTYTATPIQLDTTVNASIAGTPVELQLSVKFWLAKDIGIIRRQEYGYIYNLVSYGLDRHNDSSGNGNNGNDGSQTDSDADGITDAVDTDDDNDGIVDTEDAFPFDASEWLDSDGDGIGNNADADDDGDGYLDINDSFPLNRNEWQDTDNDGVGDNSDSDDDGDGFYDYKDAFPFDANEWLDTDGDGIGNNADTDDDGDGHLDINDDFPLHANEWLDTDKDGIGNNLDSDDDGDGYYDSNDDLPLDPNEWLDTDGDGIGNNADTDDDGDGHLDINDAFRLDSTEWLDTDGDKIGDNRDTDDDGDGHLDSNDDLPLDPSEWLDTDGDGIGNNADTDDDGDQVVDSDDAFPLDADEWLDTDGDGIGNNADVNDDGDIFDDVDDAFPLDASAPAQLIAYAGSTLYVGQENTLIVSGRQFSERDQFFIDGIEQLVTKLSDTAVQITFTPKVAGYIDLDLSYADASYSDSLQLEVSESFAYPYALSLYSGAKGKAYFDAKRQCLYVSNSTDKQLERYCYVVGGGWNKDSLAIADIVSIAFSADHQILAALESDFINIIDLDSWTIADTFSDSTTDRVVYRNAEFNHLRELLATSGYIGSGSTLVKKWNLQPSSLQYGTYSGLRSLYNSAIAASDNGLEFLFGEQGLSPVQPLQSYQADSKTWQELAITAQYASGKMDASGSRILVNNLNLYDQDYQHLATLNVGSTITATAMSAQGEFILAHTDDQMLHIFDYGNSSAVTLIPSSSAGYHKDLGDVKTIVLSDDDNTLFLLGSKGLMTVPVWQVVENRVGDAAVCPSLGCEGIQLAEGVRSPDEPQFVLPANGGTSGIESVSPVLLQQGAENEIIVQGRNFTPSSVVQFNQTLAASFKYVSNQELLVRVPASLLAGSYAVWVDGNEVGSPAVQLVSQAQVTADFWAVPGNYRELLYDARQHVLFALDTTLAQLTRIDLGDNSVVHQAAAGAKDVTWCPEDNYLYVATATQVDRYDSSDLANLGPVVFDTDGVDTLECVAGGRLVFANATDHKHFKLFDPAISKLESSQVFLSSSAGMFSRTRIDGVSARGERIIVGEQSSFPRSLMFSPFAKSVANNNPREWPYQYSSWNTEGSFGIVNDQYLVNQDGFTEIDLADIGYSNIDASTVSPNGNLVYLIFGSTVIQLKYEAEQLQLQSTYTLEANIGVASRAVTNMDGSALFIAGSQGIVSVLF